MKKRQCLENQNPAVFLSESALTKAVNNYAGEELKHTNNPRGREARGTLNING